jgi:hypothetical protein
MGNALNYLIAFLLVCTSVFLLIWRWSKPKKKIIVHSPRRQINADEARVLRQAEKFLKNDRHGYGFCFVLPTLGYEGTFLFEEIFNLRTNKEVSWKDRKNRYWFNNNRERIDVVNYLLRHGNAQENSF